MTYIYRSPVSMERDHARGGERHANIYRREGDQSYHAGDRHWTRASADKNMARSELGGFKVLYRVVVRFK